MSGTKNFVQTPKSVILETFAQAIRPFEADERQLLFDVEMLHGIRITRIRPSMVSFMRIKPEDSHDNVRRYVTLDPQKKATAIHGWWLRFDIYRFHSVIKIDDQLICITPFSVPDPFVTFYPDRSIESANVDGQMVFTRHGMLFPDTVRRDREKVMRKAAHDIRVLHAILDGQEEPKALPDYTGPPSRRRATF